MNTKLWSRQCIWTPYLNGANQTINDDHLLDSDITTTVLPQSIAVLVTLAHCNYGPKAFALRVWWCRCKRCGVYIECHHYLLLASTHASRARVINKWWSYHMFCLCPCPACNTQFCCRYLKRHCLQSGSCDPTRDVNRFGCCLLSSRLSLGLVSAVLFTIVFDTFSLAANWHTLPMANKYLTKTEAESVVNHDTADGDVNMIMWRCVLNCSPLIHLTIDTSVIPNDYQYPLRWFFGSRFRTSFASVVIDCLRQLV